MVYLAWVNCAFMQHACHAHATLMSCVHTMERHTGFLLDRVGSWVSGGGSHRQGQNDDHHRSQPAVKLSPSWWHCTQHFMPSSPTIPYFHVSESSSEPMSIWMGCTQVPDVERFMSEYNMQCPLAASRLLHSGMPATIEHKFKQRYVGTVMMLPGDVYLHWVCMSAGATCRAPPRCDHTSGRPSCSTITNLKSRILSPAH